MGNIKYDPPIIDYIDGKFDTSTGHDHDGTDSKITYFLSTHYQASGLWAAKTVSAAADRYKILSPSAIELDIGGNGYRKTSQTTLDLSLEATWDTVAGTDYRTAGNRAGKDFYIYACVPGSGTVPDFKVSANSTVPSGYNANTSRKVAGFHCLCVAVAHATTLTAWTADTVMVLGQTVKPTVWLATNKIARCTARAGDFKTHAATEPDWAATAINSTVVDDQITWTVEVHALEGYVAGDVLPYSVWDNQYLKPVSSPSGMFYLPSHRIFMDIYLNSGDGLTTASVYNGTISHNRTPLQYDADFAAVNKRCVRRQEFIAGAQGGGANGVAAGGDPTQTGGKSDAYGRRLVSSYGAEDVCGHHYQVSLDYASTNRVIVGGYVGSGGASPITQSSTPETTGNTTYASRGAAEVATGSPY